MQGGSPLGRAELLERATNIVLPVLERLGYDLVEVAVVVSHGRRILRVFIYRRGGVTLEDCARASKALGAELDQHSLFSGRYFLEVSSPGAERRLRGREDFERFQGSKARVRFRAADGRAAEATGRIGGFAGDVLVLEPEGAGEVSIPFESILGANLSL
jgi:ribosome maturation factor RimP